MNDEQHAAQQLRDFYMDDESGTHDRSALLRDVLDTVHKTPQQRRRRWWPFRRHTASTSTLPSRDLQPDPASAAANGQVPSSGGSVPVLTGVLTFAAAVVLVVIVGGFLLFGAFAPESPSILPGASESASPDSTIESIPPSTEDPVDLKTPLATALVVATMPPGAGVAGAEPDFTGELVATGIERIVSDGATFDLRALPDDVRYAFEDIAISPGGDIWVVAYRHHADTGRTEGPLVWELGSETVTGPADGFPREFQKVLIDADGTAIVVADDGVRAFDGEGWVDDPGTRRIPGDEMTTWIIEPPDLTAIGEGALDDTQTPTDVLAVRSDGAGYVLGDELGFRHVREWPTAWFSCSREAIDYGGPNDPNGCDQRPVADGRGLGASHNDSTSGLLLADETTGRFDRHEDSSLWVLTGPTIEDLWSGRAEESGAIYRIDGSADGFRCNGCY